MKFFKIAIVDIMQKITDNTLIFNPNIRCVISGKLMRYSNKLAGLVYRFFYIFISAVIFLMCLMLFIGFRVILK